MDLRSVSTDKAPKAIGPYSQAIVTGDLVFTAGQVALDPATGELDGRHERAAARCAHRDRMRRRPPLTDDKEGASLPPVATGIALGLWIALMLILAFVVVPLLFGICASPDTAL